MRISAEMGLTGIPYQAQPTYPSQKKGNNKLGPAANRARAEWPPNRVLALQRRWSTKAEPPRRRCASTMQACKRARHPCRDAPAADSPRAPCSVRLRRPPGARSIMCRRWIVCTRVACVRDAFLAAPLLQLVQDICSYNLIRRYYPVYSHA